MSLILTTKLFIPPARLELVPRPRLIKRLNNGLDCRLTLISAPAGFGKTTLVTEWLANLQGAANKENQLENRVSWLSLDEGDNDPRRFLTYFITALNQIEGMDATGALTMLQSPQPPPTETVLISLINKIAGLTNATIPDRIILVLDDYHLIEAQPIHDALTFFIENIPPQMHLVITTRVDPFLPLSRLRARGQMTELRAADLRFTTSEAAEFLNQIMGLGLSMKDIAALETRTEGWIAGLQLAALAMQGAISLQGHTDTSKLIQSFTGSNRLVLDYLIEEVLDQQSEEIQNFLLQTSILDRLTGSLCDAVRFDFAKTPIGQENGQSTLEMLERANLFIVPLDDERRWYRYHHLFADLLHQQLRQTHLEQIPTLHSRASEWYEMNDLPSDAIQHALAAEDFERAAALAELAWPDWKGSFQSIAWLGWVKGLPGELVRARPVLSVAYAWANLNAGKLETAEARLLDAERCLEKNTKIRDQQEAPLTDMVVVDEEQWQGLPVSLAAARAYHAQAIGDVPGTVKYTKRVLDILPEGDQQWRHEAKVILGLAYWTSGDLEAAHRTVSDGLAGMNPLDVIIGTFVLADIKMTLGQLHAAISTYENALQLATEHGEPMPLGTEDVYTGISVLHRERGDLDVAAQDLLTSKKLGEQVELPDWKHRWCIAQARLNETLGDLDGAFDLLDEAERLFIRTPLPKMRPIAAMKARVWIRQGKLADALTWKRNQSLFVDDDLSYLREFEHITLTRMLIAQYQNDQVDKTIQDAIGLLERLLQAAEEGKRMGSVIEILMLQALAHEAQGNIPPALVSLERALMLAEPEGYIRLFVDEGQPMAKLLTEAARRGIQLDYSHKLLAVFESNNVDNTRQIQPLIEPLSARELEVLQLVAQGLSNRQIGEKLFLALDTIKGHNRKIFEKLGVNKRIEAVTRARELGLL